MFLGVLANKCAHAIGTLMQVRSRPWRCPFVGLLYRNFARLACALRETTQSTQTQLDCLISACSMPGKCPLNYRPRLFLATAGQCGAAGREPVVERNQGKRQCILLYATRIMLHMRTIVVTARWRQLSVLSNLQYGVCYGVPSLPSAGLQLCPGRIWLHATNTLACIPARPQPKTVRYLSSLLTSFNHSTFPPAA